MEALGGGQQEAQTQAARTKAPKVDTGKRASELSKEIGNLTDAIASGLLKASPGLATRLAAAESELAALQEGERRATARVAGRIVPNVGKIFLRVVTQLEESLKRDPQRARDVLAGIFGEKVVLDPDESGRLLWADYGIGAAMPMLAEAVGADSSVLIGSGGVIPTNSPVIVPFGIVDRRPPLQMARPKAAPARPPR